MCYFWCTFVYFASQSQYIGVAQQIIARYGRQTLSKADIVTQRRIPLATAFKPDE
jgi:hypothetical protein